MSVPKDDFDLLRSYVERRNESAFAELVERHVGMVYAAAVRQVGRGGSADDIVQAVFILLEQKAPQFDRGVILAAWLHRTTRFAALNAMKSERRRRRHERSARADAHEHRPRSHEVASSDDWAAGAILLDEGVNQLGAADRAAIVLRYLEKRPFAEVGKRLGVSEEAAQMRVGRAVEKLRTFFRRNGIAMSATSLTAAIDVNNVTSVPASLKSLLMPQPMLAAQAATSQSAAVSLAGQTGQSIFFAKIRTSAIYIMIAAIAVAVIGLLVMQLLSYRPTKPSGSSRGPDRAMIQKPTPARPGHIEPTVAADAPLSERGTSTHA